MTERVTALINGLRFEDWQDVEITASLEGVGRSFALGASGLTLGETTIRMEDEIEISIDGTRVLTGYVEAPGTEDSAEDRGYDIAGRSRAVDLVDCSNIAKRVHKGRTFTQIAEALAAPYGVPVVVATPDPLLSAPIKRFVVKPDETAFAAIERAAKLRAVILYDDELGRLVLQVGARGRFALQIGAVIRRGENLLSAQSGSDASKLYSEYRIKGQRFASDNDSGGAVSAVSGKATGDGSRRLRVKTLISKSSLTAAQAKSRAQWEAANAFGRANSYTATVRGWTDQTGALWTPGTLIEIDDPLHLWQGVFLVISVVFSKSTEGGTTSTVTVAPEAGYYAELPENPRKGLGAWRALT